MKAMVVGLGVLYNVQHFGPFLRKHKPPVKQAILDACVSVSMA